MLDRSIYQYRDEHWYNKIEATTQQISLKITETYTWFEKPKSYCLNLKITVKITIRQKNTYKNTWIVNSLANFTCKSLQGTCKSEIYLHILIVLFWELFVNCFVKPAPWEGAFLLAETKEFVDANWQPSFFLKMVCWRICASFFFWLRKK